MGKTFSACELIELAIHIEENGKAFYYELAKETKDSKARKALEYLADAEDKHIAVFQKMFKASCDYNPEGAYPDEYFAYIRSLASNYIFTQSGKGLEEAKSVSSYSEGLDLGIQFEKDSILFYQEMIKFAPDSEHGKIIALINEEKKHLERLIDLKMGGER